MDALLAYVIDNGGAADPSLVRDAENAIVSQEDASDDRTFTIRRWNVGTIPAPTIAQLREYKELLRNPTEAKRDLGAKIVYSKMDPATVRVLVGLARAIYPASSAGEVELWVARLARGGGIRPPAPDPAK